MQRMITTRYKSFFNRCFDAPARVLARAGVTPNLLTLAGLLLGLLCCLWFVLTRRTALFCIFLTAVGLCDALDGAVARVTGRSTKFGAYLDAMADRYVEAAVALAAAYVTGYWVLSLVVLAGSFGISYAKARAAMEAPIANNEWPDWMERAERGALFILGLFGSAVLPWRPLGRDLFWWTLLLLAAATHATVIQRMLRARRLIAARSPAG